MVDPERLELPTLAFEAQCSIQLSYGSLRDEAPQCLKSRPKRPCRTIFEGHSTARSGITKKPRQPESQKAIFPLSPGPLLVCWCALSDDLRILDLGAFNVQYAPRSFSETPAKVRFGSVSKATSSNVL
jgi:hypothetical protein